MPRVWIITGASSGFGLELAKIAAKAGDSVITTSRDPSKLEKVDGITPMRLDQNEPLDQVKKDIDAMVAVHGHVDILVNNAAYVQTGTLEETSPEETLSQLQANVLGPLNVYRAVLPHMRAAKSGILVTIGSVNAWLNLDAFNLYNISKAAVRAMGMGLAGEVRPFGIRHCLVEPGAFRTSILQSSTNLAATGGTARLSDYAQVNAKADGIVAGFSGQQPGDPVKGCQVIFDVLTSTGAAQGRELPEFLPLGVDAVDAIKQSAQKTISQVEEWQDLATQTSF
ncbi:(S,S)-butanediol dehydrogenase [Microdochium nivale]|nr:(S,S)-butanediol dehydrogenase [Microdochium nivale]